MNKIQTEELPFYEEVAHFGETLHARSAIVATLQFVRQAIALAMLYALVRLAKPSCVRKRVKTPNLGL